MRRWLALSATVIVLGVSSVARAQEDFKPFDNTVRLSTLLEGARQNGRYYGAVAAYDRFVTRSPFEKDSFVFAGEATSAFNVMSVPGCLDVDCRSGKYVLNSYDMVASNTVVQLCSGRDQKDSLSPEVCAFGAWAVTGVFRSDQRAVDHFMFHVATRLMSVIGVYGMLGKQKHRSDASGFVPSGLLGGSFVFGDVATARAGYLNGVDESGFYANASIDPAKLFATAALSERFQNLATLIAGFDRIPMPLDALGNTSLFGRKLQFGSPGLVGSDGLPVADRASRFDFWTAHIEQQNLGQWVDLKYAHEIEPEPRLHFAALSVHNPGYYPVRAGDGSRGGGGGFSGSAGVVRMPTIASMGVRGGIKPYLDAEVGTTSLSDKLDFRGSLRIRYNEPEFVTLFPFAQDSLTVYYMLHAAM